MLVLSRVVGELISIGDDITLRVLSVNGSSVRFGVEAPKRSMYTAPRSMTGSSARRQRRRLADGFSRIDAWVRRA